MSSSLPSKINIAGDDFSRDADQAHDGKRSDAFSAARFAHQAQDFTRADIKINAIHSFDDAVFGKKIGLKVLDLKQGSSYGFCH